MTNATFEDQFPAVNTPPPRLSKILKKEFCEPEGRIRCEWVSRLVSEYGFSFDQVAINVAAGAGRDAERSSVFADIVAYRDKRRREPFLVVETKRPEEKAGIKQVESYARNLGADYHIWTNGAATRFFRTARYIGQSTQIGNVPRWLGNKPVEQKPPKKLDLPPFRDEKHLREVVNHCHNQIFYRLGHDPAKAFDELMKILFLKLYDERETPKHYDCVVLAGETNQATARRVRQLFDRSIKSRRYKDVFTTRLTDKHPPSIDLDDETITFIVRHFQGYSLINTSATLEGADVKGTVFERMVGGTFRGELGAYFTPREIVSFMVQMLEPELDDVILDPACGSGGFLIMTLKYALEQLRTNSPNLDEAEIYSSIQSFAHNNVIGTDINERMARVTKMNMIMHGDGHGGIFHMHGLDVGFAANPSIKYGEATCIFSNPPFAGREEDPKQLTKFNTTKNVSGTLLETPKSIPFVEHILSLLSEGGRAALVLPNGIFNSQSVQFSQLRELIWSKSEILAIVGLPHWVFFHTGCDVQGSLLFLQRTEEPRSNYNIHVDWAEHVGYDTKGQKTEENDLPSIIQRYRERTASNQFNAQDIRKRGRMDPLYYQPGEHDRVSRLTGPSAPLTDILVLTTEAIRRSRDNNEQIRYLEVGGTDKDTGAIVTTQEFEIRNLPSRAKYIVRENMLLIPNHRNSIKAGRSVVLVPAEYDGIVVTSRFIVARSRIPSIYLYHILNLTVVKEKMLRLVSVSSSTEIKFDQLKEILVPLPKGGDFDLFVENVEMRQAEIVGLKRRLLQKEEELEVLFSDLY